MIGTRFGSQKRVSLHLKVRCICDLQREVAVLFFSCVLVIPVAVQLKGKETITYPHILWNHNNNYLLVWIYIVYEPRSAVLIEATHSHNTTVLTIPQLYLPNG